MNQKADKNNRCDISWQGEFKITSLASLTKIIGAVVLVRDLIPCSLKLIKGGKMEDKILIVEDDLENGIAVLTAMDELGLEAEVVPNAEEAIKKIETESYLAVLTDMNMPLKKGESVNPKAGEAVVNACAKKMTPCVVVTAGYNAHHKSDHVYILTSSMFCEKPAEPLFELARFSGRKDDADNWRQIWRTVEDKFKTVFSARRRYIKYVLS